MGRVRSLDRVIEVKAGANAEQKPAHLRRRKGRLLSVNTCRYANVTINRKTVFVHHLVAEVFIGPRPFGLIVCHGPNGRLDNRLENISYGTHSKNLGEDKRRDGTMARQRGERCGTSKLTEEQVIEIKRRSLAGESRASLGHEFGVRAENISHIALGRSWGWLEVA